MFKHDARKDIEFYFEARSYLPLNFCFRLKERSGDFTRLLI